MQIPATNLDKVRSGLTHVPMSGSRAGHLEVDPGTKTVVSQPCSLAPIN